MTKTNTTPEHADPGAAQDAIFHAMLRAHALTAMMQDRDENQGERRTMAPNVSSDIAGMIAEELVIIQAAINVITVGTPEGHNPNPLRAYVLRRAASNHGPCGFPFWTGPVSPEDATTKAQAVEAIA